MRSSRGYYPISLVYREINEGKIIFGSNSKTPEWSIEDKSLLIDSILTMIVPNIFAIEIYNKERKGHILKVIDGSQRLSIIQDFISNKWALTELKPIVLPKFHECDEQFNISGLKFSELPFCIQMLIKDHILMFSIVEDIEESDEENIVNKLCCILK